MTEAVAPVSLLALKNKFNLNKESVKINIFLKILVYLFNILEYWKAQVFGAGLGW
jgi:hypothetical protein